MIRKLQKKDADQVALLIKQLTKNITEPHYLVERIKKLVKQKNSQFLVVELDGRVVGFGGVVWYAISSKGLIAWVEEVVVDSQYRGRGIGSVLMKNILKLAKQKKIQQIKLTSTPAAKNLYKKMGFIKKDHDYLARNLS